MPNTRFCADKGAQGATCDYTNGGTEEHYDKSTWDQMRFGWVCTDIDSITALIGVIKKLCFDDGRCTYQEQKEAIRTIEAVEDKLLCLGRDIRK